MNNITIFDKINIIFLSFSIFKFLPNFRIKIWNFFQGISFTRNFEFLYLIKFIKKKQIKNINILDVSSPYLMAYILAKDNKVIKTDIDEREIKFIKESDNISFKMEDATKLSFPDNYFDLTYSISVIEHIYEEYAKAIFEMIRVTKEGGYIYITCPVSITHTEEWTNSKAYSNQKELNNKFFFQYRFDNKDIDIIKNIKGVELLFYDIFWEKKNGLYDRIIYKLRKKNGNKYLNFIRNSFIHYYYGFNFFKLKPSVDFGLGSSFGNVHFIFKKIKE